MRAQKYLRHWPWCAIAILLLAAGIAVILAMQQRATLQWIGENGGRYHTEPGFLVRQLPPPVKRWLNRRWGNRWSDPIDTVVGVAISGVDLTATDLARLLRLRRLESLHLVKTKVTEAMMEQVAEFSRLRVLDLGDTHIGENGLNCLLKLPKLERLSLHNTNVTDAMLEPVTELSQLRVLGLGETNVGDDGLKCLPKLPKLEKLTLNGTNVTDSGLLHLRECGELWELILEDTHVTDAGIPHLQQCRKLTVLNLSGTHVSDAGMIHFKKLSKLEIMLINNTEVTDKGMIHLEELTELKSLIIGGTKVTNAEREWLKKALPNLEIIPEKTPHDWPEALPRLSPIGGI